jgi:hypothetical protein
MVCFFAFSPSGCINKISQVVTLKSLIRRAELGALHALTFILHSESLTNLRQIEELIMNALWYGVADSAAQARLASPFEAGQNCIPAPSAENGVDNKTALRDSHSFDFLELCAGSVVPFLMPAHLPLLSSTASASSSAFENAKASQAPPSHSAFAVSKHAPGKVGRRVSEQESARRTSEAAKENFRKFSLQRRNLLRGESPTLNESSMASECVTASTVHLFSRALITIRRHRDAVVSRIHQQHELNRVGTVAAAGAHSGLFTQYLDNQTSSLSAAASFDSSACAEILSVADVPLVRRSVIFWMDALCALAHQACSFQLMDRHRVFAVCAARSLAESLNLMQPQQIKRLIRWCLRAIGASEFEFHADDRFFQDLAAFLIGSILQLLRTESEVSATTSASSGGADSAASLLFSSVSIPFHSGGALLLDALHAPHESRFRHVAAASALSSRAPGAVKEVAESAPEFKTLEEFLCMEAKLEAIRWRKLKSFAKGASERALHVRIRERIFCLCADECALSACIRLPFDSMISFMTRTTGLDFRLHLSANSAPTPTCSRLASCTILQ